MSDLQPDHRYHEQVEEELEIPDEVRRRFRKQGMPFVVAGLLFLLFMTLLELLRGSGIGRFINLPYGSGLMFFFPYGVILLYLVILVVNYCGLKFLYDMTLGGAKARGLEEDLKPLPDGEKFQLRMLDDCFAFLAVLPLLLLLIFYAIVLFFSRGTPQGFVYVILSILNYLTIIGASALTIINPVVLLRHHARLRVTGEEFKPRLREFPVWLVLAFLVSTIFTISMQNIFQFSMIARILSICFEVAVFCIMIYEFRRTKNYL